MMSDNELVAWREALNRIPSKWIAEFTSLVEDGQASDEFLAFFEANVDCQRAFEQVLRSDAVSRKLAHLFDEEDQKATRESSQEVLG